MISAGDRKYHAQRRRRSLGYICTGDDGYHFSCDNSFILRYLVSSPAHTSKERFFSEARLRTPALKAGFKSLFCSAGARSFYAAACNPTDNFTRPRLAADRPRHDRQLAPGSFFRKVFQSALRIFHAGIVPT